MPLAAISRAPPENRLITAAPLLSSGLEAFQTLFYCREEADSVHSYLYIGSRSRLARVSGWAFFVAPSLIILPLQDDGCVKCGTL